jgi:hypothetical protein
MFTSSDRVIWRMLTDGTHSIMLGLGGYLCSSHTQNIIVDGLEGFNL